MNKLKENVQEKQQRADAIQGCVIDEYARNILIEEHNFYRSAWKTRKDKCIGVIDTLAEGMEKSRNHVIVSSIPNNNNNQILLM